jgi:hypothetical protein
MEERRVISPEWSQPLSAWEIPWLFASAKRISQQQLIF